MKKIIITGAFLMAAFFVKAQSTSEILKSDVVEVVDGSFVYDDYQNVKSNGNSININAHVEASEDMISRDNFVKLSGSIIDETIAGLYDENAEIDSAEETAEPDIQLNCFMTPAGINISIISKEETKTIVHKWSELL